MRTETSPWSGNRLRVTAAVALALLGCLVTLPTWLDIGRIALMDEEASHVLLVPPTVAWLVWNRLGDLSKWCPSSSWAGVAVVLCGGLLSAWGYRHATQVAWHFGAVLVPCGCLVTVLGSQLFSRLFPAFLLLAFLVPVPGLLRQRVSIPLMTATAAVTAEACRVAGMDVQRSGNELEVNGQSITVVEACNGLRLVFALLLVTIAFTFSEPIGTAMSLAIIIASPLSAVLCNALRLVVTVWLHARGWNGLAEAVHASGGWIAIALAFLMLVGTHKLLRRIGPAAGALRRCESGPCAVFKP